MQAEPEILNYTPAPATHRVLAVAGVSVFSGGCVAVAYFDPVKTSFFPVCPLYSLTGFACPGCGLTRGFHALFQGDLLAAIDFNALIPVWVVIFGWVALSLLLIAVRGRGLTMWPTSPRFLTIFLFVLLGFGVLRNLPVYPFTILFP